MISKINVHQVPLPRSLTETEQKIVNEVKALYSKDLDKTIELGHAKLSEDIWQPTYHNLVHQDHMNEWKQSLNPLQKVANAVLPEGLAKLVLPQKPEHPTMKAERVAAENKLLFSLEAGFTGHDN